MSPSVTCDSTMEEEIDMNIDGVEEETVAMDENHYNESVARSLLPEDKNYSFESIHLVSDMDENGEVKIDVVGRTDVHDTNGVKTFLADFYTSSGSTFNIKSGRADRSGEQCDIRGYRKCMMQVHQKNVNNPKRKGLHQNCEAEISFRLDKPKVRNSDRPILNSPLNAFYSRLF